MKMPCIKKQYSTRETARHVLKTSRKRGKRMNDEEYWCPECACYHISMRNNVPKQKAA